MTTDYSAYRAAQTRAQEADRADNGETLTRCIHTRRRRKCIAAGEHQDPPPDAIEPANCPRCGL